eukprot:SAG25_NODE_897_length_4875_cov_2.036223_3_plen_106_part_00
MFGAESSLGSTAPGGETWRGAFGQLSERAFLSVERGELFVFTHGVCYICLFHVHSHSDQSLTEIPQLLTQTPRGAANHSGSFPQGIVGSHAMVAATPSLMSIWPW